MKYLEKSFDVVVCGGGMAGFCAAVAAARGGAKTCLVQDRPVLGGNASSEVRVTVHGAACHHPGMRETGEIHAAPKASQDTMGSSIHIRCIDTGRPAPFKAPDWAMHYEDAAFFYEQGRLPNEPEGGFWWLEIGVPYNTIYDNEEIRHELTRHALGVWDWMKNKDPKMMDKCANYALEFIGQVPGKRESRRLIGHHFINENELQDRVAYPDECAYGGWFIDLHTPGGLLAPTAEENSAVGYNSDLKSVALKYIGPYGIPLGSLISKDVANLGMAGRNISTTHAALGTVRVMATCGLMGDDGWQDIVVETANSSHRRRHTLDTPIRTSALRLLVEQTHLSRSAGLVEMRCYN